VAQAIEKDVRHLVPGLRQNAMDRKATGRLADGRPGDVRDLYWMRSPQGKEVRG
jgi:hypothetical protein